MIARFVMIVVLLALAIYAYRSARRMLLLGGLFLLLGLSGIFFVLRPDAATALANQVGIGRGTDLVLYGWVLFSFLALLHLTVRLRAQHEAITRLARELAILNAREPGQGDPPGPTR